MFYLRLHCLLKSFGMKSILALRTDFAVFSILLFHSVTKDKRLELAENLILHTAAESINYTAQESKQAS